jgi:hypothetical protein
MLVVPHIGFLQPYLLQLRLLFRKIVRAGYREKG